MNGRQQRVHASSPVFDFIHVLRRGEPQLKYLPRIIGGFLKYLLFEPFRLMDALYLRLRHADFRMAKDPVFILGYYRSGTTHLQETLLQDPRFGHLNFYQCFFPKGFFSSEWLLKRPFNWILRQVGFRHPAHNIPFHFGLPGEEDVSMVSSGFRLASSQGQVFPKFFRDYWNKTVFFDTCTAEERQLFEQELTDFLGRIAVANDNKQLLLKSPPQTARIPMLRRLYPNAKFVFIYRDPFLVYRSNLKLWRSFRGHALHDFSDELASEHVLWSFDKVMERYEVDKALLGENQLVEIRYEDLLADPLGNLEKIYETLQLGGFDEVKPRFTGYLAKTHGSNLDRYELTPGEIASVESRWNRWLTLWGYPRRSPPPQPEARAAHG